MAKIDVKNLAVTGLVVKGSNGCDWWRTLIPFWELGNRGYNVRVAHYGDNLGTKPDVLVCNRMGFRTREQAQEFLAISHEQGTIIVVDQDDDNTIIPHDSPHWEGELKDFQGRLGLEYADLVTCTTEHLARRFRQINPNVAVLPNLVDPHVWKMPNDINWRMDKRLTVGVHGGDSHYNDWTIIPALFERLAARYSELRFFIGGDKPTWLTDLQSTLGNRLTCVGWTDVEHYPYTVGQIDIGLCPLTDNEFNLCKSPIKWMESAMLSRPVVASQTLYGDYIADGKTGLIAGDELYNWFNAVCQLIDNKALRRKIGLNAHFEVLRKWNIHDRAHTDKRINAYVQAWERVFGRKWHDANHRATRGKENNAVCHSARDQSNTNGRAIRSDGERSSRFPHAFSLGARSSQ